MADLVVRGERVALPTGIRAATIHVRDGRIVRIGTYGDRVPGVAGIDAGSFVVLPGLVDTHVHVNEPGRTSWEGFETATRAAAAGGVTTIVDMPLNSIPATTTVAALEEKRAAATGRCHVDVSFWGGVVPGNAEHLEPLVRAGVPGFKCFLTPSGVDEFAHVTEPDLREALPILARLGVPLLVHAEWPDDFILPAEGADPRRYRTWLETRPARAEVHAIERVIDLAREYGARMHIVHLATADALPVLRTARAAGVPVSVETCPHYLTFASEDISDGATALKCAPPIREHDHRERLWQALADFNIDFVATDHSPAPPSLKRLVEGDFLTAWGGIASLQLGLAATWTGAAARGLPLDRLGGWLATGPARFAGLSRSKGTIEVGRDADLVIWDPDEEWTVDGAALYHRHPVTPYHGVRMRGRVRTTLLRGDVIFDAHQCRGPARGRLLPQ